MKIENIKIQPPDDCNIIIGQSHFIKTVEDIYEAIVTNVPQAKFGLAFNEASGDRLIRYDGTDDELIESACEISEKLRCGHIFVVLLRDAFPINVLNAIKMVSEVCGIYVATANPLVVIIARLDGSSAFLGVADGLEPKDRENNNDKTKRRKFLRDIGYKK